MYGYKMQLARVPASCPHARPVPLGYRYQGIRYSIVMTPDAHF
ncbi:MAG: hypothetical protein ACW98K_13960 [Candidatus Kariarchaeaceae archaeon]